MPVGTIFHPDWHTSFDASNEAVATEIAHTKRQGITSNRGRRGAALYLVNIPITPLVQPSRETARDSVFRLREELGAAMEFLETTTHASRDFQEGDILIVGNKEYPIRDVLDSSIHGVTRVRLLVEDVK